MQTINKLLRLPDVEQLTGLKKSSLYALMKAGLFPKVVKISERASRWPEAEIETWINQRIAARDTAVA